jgi:hypothetical protein
VKCVRKKGPKINKICDFDLAYAPQSILSCFGSRIGFERDHAKKEQKKSCPLPSVKAYPGLCSIVVCSSNCCSDPFLPLHDF